MATRKKPDFAFLRDILKEATGQELERDPDLSEIRRAQDRIQARRDSKVVNQNGLIFALHHPHSMTPRICKNCKKLYYTSHCRDAVCSQECRDREFTAHFGVSPDSILTTSEYTYERHASLDPEQSARVFALALRIIRDEAQVTGEYLGDTTLAETLTPLLERVTELREALASSVEEEPTIPHTPQPAPSSVSDDSLDSWEVESLELPSFEFRLDG